LRPGFFQSGGRGFPLEPRLFEPGPGLVGFLNGGRSGLVQPPGRLPGLAGFLHGFPGGGEVRLLALNREVGPLDGENEILKRTVEPKFVGEKGAPRGLEPMPPFPSEIVNRVG